MPPISFKAIAIAFTAEIAADAIIRTILFGLFARGMVTAETTQVEFERVRLAVLENSDYIPWAVALGIATTIGGGYLAARIARRIPYYHGLAMGIVGIAFILLLWPDESGWLEYLGLLVTIPASLLGAHIARQHMEPDPA
jgi:hypothetical protein